MRDRATAQGQERLGLVFAGLCALNGAFVPAVAKLTTAGASAFFVATFSSLIAGVSAAVVLGARGQLSALVEPGVRVSLVMVGLLGTALAYLLFFLGASRSTAIETVLCLQIEPAYSLLAAWVVLRHRPTARRLAATALLLVGITLAIGGRIVSPSSGAWLLLLAPACWQASHLVVLRRLGRVSPSLLSGARYLYGSVLLLLGWLAIEGVATAPPLAELVRRLPLLAVQGAVLTYGGTFLWYQAITRIDLARTTAIVVPSIPLLSLLASFILIGEVPSLQQWIGLLLSGAGVLAFVTAPDVVEAPAPVVLAAAAE